MPQPPSHIGKVYLVGAGPGDPGLITLRGCQCLAQADVVLYDYLVNPVILDHAPRAEKICLGRHRRDHRSGSADAIVPQAEINQRLVALARAGRTVVRLKGGDPAVFAHAAGEVAALRAASIPLEIVPGITVALSAGSHTEIPLTHGKLASAVALITGQERAGKDGSALNYSAFAAFPGTLVFYMGVTTAREWTSQLISAGKSEQTPAVIIRRCSWPDQETVLTTLGAVADELDRRKMRPPVVVIVGEVAGLAPAQNWFSSRPLFGVRVLVTRAAQQAAALADPLRELGADVLLQPAIEIDLPQDMGRLDSVLSRLDEFETIVFSSANGVEFFFKRLLSTGLDLRALGKACLAAIGPGTAETLARFRLRADVVPKEFRAEALAESLAKTASGNRILLVRASRGREVLSEQLVAAGATVEQVVAYESRDVTSVDSEVMAALTAGQVDWITVTSSAIARALAGQFGDALRNARLVSISPITTATLRELGFEPAAEAREYTMEGVIAALRAALEA